MNAFIRKTNQYLIERFPNIWNVRLLWMLMIALLIHILFFIGGFFSVQLPKILQSYSSSDEWFMSTFGVIPFSIIISIVIIVIWIVALLKNNGFKNYYPHSRPKLFLSFWYMFLIFLANSTFYLSFSLGYKIYLNQSYPDVLLKEYVDKGDLASVFFNFSMADYDLKNKKYPAPFDSIYIETNYSAIDESRPFIKTQNSLYQFYTVKVDTCNENAIKDCSVKNQGAINSKRFQDSLTLYYLKNKVVDLSAQVDTHLTYFNFSSPYFAEFNNRNIHYDSYESTYSDEQKLFIKEYCHKVQVLLQSKNKAEVEKVMTDFLEICAKMKIATNITLEDWMRIAYKPDAYRVDSFIYNKNEAIYRNDEIAIPSPQPTAQDMTAQTASVSDTSYESKTINQEQLDYQKYLSRLTPYYIDADALKNNLANITDLKKYYFLHVAWKVHIWVAFALASLLFMYRVTDLKSVIFSGIGTAIISVFVALVLLVFNMSRAYNSGGGDGMFNFYFIIFVMAVVLSLPIFMSKNFNKLIKGTFINITIVVPVLFILMVIFTLDEYLRNECYNQFDPKCHYESTFSVYTNEIYWGLLIFAFVFNYIYFKYIIKWKGLPEG